MNKTVALSSSRAAAASVEGRFSAWPALCGEAPIDFRQRLSADGSGLRYVR